MNSDQPTTEGFRPKSLRGSRLVLGVTLGLLTGFVPAGSVTAQSASLRGRILDAVTGAPVPGATVAATSAGISARTDSTGHYVLDGLKVGIHRFLVSATGYLRGSVSLAFAPRERMERDFELDPVGTPMPGDTARAQQLPTVPVAADASLGRRFLDFERRKATGRGQYLTRTDFERNNFYTLQDAMRTLRGIRFSCSGGSCTAQMARAPMGCAPEYIVDERVDNTFGPTIPVRDIQGLEVYTGASDVPGEFAGRNAGCGVIVIWTTAGREPRRK